MKNGMTTVFLVAVAGFAIWAFSSAWEPLENSGDFVSSIVSSSASPPIRSGLGGESQAGPEAVQLRSVYDDAAAVLGSRSLSRQQKQDRVRVIQQNYGQGVLTAVIRHVPVYDEASGQMVTFDTYMRNMAGEYSYNSGAPMDLDPVGAALRIFFDPSTETVQSMTGIGMLAHITEMVGNFAAHLTRDEMAYGAQERGLNWGSIRAPDELVDDGHLNDRGFWVEVPHPELDRSFKYPGPAGIYNGSPWRSIIGQMMEYAAHATRTWNVGDIRQAFENSMGAEGKRPGRCVGGPVTDIW